MDEHEVANGWIILNTFIPGEKYVMEGLSYHALSG